ncbi:MAG TPA: helix-turn-helix transcriptional regulator [Candidatus Polarisedimenticolia bacterium]|nr:helix-turn-helix transcriptional regulator [Candidatus Polarisedimenticolia bacterium]
MNSGRSRWKQPALVGERIRTLRKDRNLTQTELASRIGIQQSDLCRMENGEYKVSLETLFKILSIFEMNVAEFFHEQLPPGVSESDVDFLHDYRKLDPEAQKEVWDFLRFKRTDNEEKDPREKTLGERNRDRDKKE